MAHAGQKYPAIIQLELVLRVDADLIDLGSFVFKRKGGGEVPVNRVVDIHRNGISWVAVRTAVVDFQLLIISAQ